MAGSRWVGTTTIARESSMFGIIAVILVILWLGGFFAFHIAGGLIHLLLLLALIAIVVHFVTGRRAV
jgi:hypothetical protein